MAVAAVARAGKLLDPLHAVRVAAKRRNGADIEGLAGLPIYEKLRVGVEVIDVDKVLLREGRSKLLLEELRVLHADAE